MTKAQPQAPWKRENPKSGSDHQSLSPQAKAAAKRRAQKAGRPYPNLVDNMHEAQHTDGKQPTASKSAAKGTAAKKASAKAAAAKKAPARKAAPGTASKATRKSASKGASTATSTSTAKAPAKTARTPAKKAAATKAPARKASSTSTRDPKGGLTAAGRAESARKDGAHLKPGVTKSVADMTPEEMRRKGSWAVRFYGRETLPPLKKANGEPTRFALSAHAWGEPVPKTEAQARKIAARGERLLKRYEALKAKDKATRAKAKTKR